MQKLRSASHAVSGTQGKEVLLGCLPDEVVEGQAGACEPKGGL